MPKCQVHDISLVGNRPQDGYFPEEVKSIYIICKDKDEEVAQAAFAEVGSNTLTYSQDRCILGASLSVGH